MTDSVSGSDDDVGGSYLVRFDFHPWDTVAPELVLAVAGANTVIEEVGTISAGEDHATSTEEHLAAFVSFGPRSTASKRPEQRVKNPPLGESGHVVSRHWEVEVVLVILDRFLNTLDNQGPEGSE